MSVVTKYEPRYHSIDAWRGVACLMVVVLHTGYFALFQTEGSGSAFRVWVVWWLRWLEMGVPLFFVISGYCIAASMDRHRRRGDSSWGFLARRIQRIYPPYWASLAAFVGVIWALDRFGLTWLHQGRNSLELFSPGQLDWTQWLGNLTLTEMWRQRAWGGSSGLVYTRVAWSLCFEEQFYFVSFLILWLFPRRLYGAMGWATALIVGYRIFAYDVGWLFRYAGSFLELWHEFAVGLLVYWSLVAAPSKRARLVVDLILVAVVIVGVATDFRSTWVAALFGLVLIRLRPFDERASHLKLLNPLRACGHRSYSIYLIHLLVCTIGNELLAHLGVVGLWPKLLVMTPVVSAISVGVGWVFFWAVESRFLSKKVVSGRLSVVNQEASKKNPEILTDH